MLWTIYLCTTAGILLAESVIIVLERGTGYRSVDVAWWCAGTLLIAFAWPLLAVAFLVSYALGVRCPP